MHKRRSELRRDLVWAVRRHAERLEEAVELRVRAEHALRDRRARLRALDARDDALHLAGGSRELVRVVSAGIPREAGLIPACSASGGNTLKTLETVPQHAEHFQTAINTRTTLPSGGLKDLHNT